MAGCWPSALGLHGVAGLAIILNMLRRRIEALENQVHGGCALSSVVTEITPERVMGSSKYGRHVV